MRTEIRGSLLGETSGPEQLRRFGILAVLAVAIVIRALWVAYSCANGAVFGRGHPFAEGEMSRIAVNLAENRGFSSPFGIGSQSTAWECPLVPFIYAATLKLAGGPDVRAATLVFYVQSIIGGLGAWLYWLTIQRLTKPNSAKLASWVSPAVAALVCFWPESVVSVTALWYYVWQEAFIALFLFALLLWTKRGTPVTAANAGLCCGALALVSVTPVPAAMILMGAAAWRSRRNGYRGALIAAACFAAVIAPWLIRNSIAFDTVVPLRSNAGFELFQGNNPIECIREPANAPHPASDLVQYRLYEQMGEIAYSRRCLDLAASYVQAHPLQTAHRIVARVYIVWLTDLSGHWAPSYVVPFGQRSTLYKLRYISAAC